jgi:hypothetical protein
VVSSSPDVSYFFYYFPENVSFDLNTFSVFLHNFEWLYHNGRGCMKANGTQGLPATKEIDEQNRDERKPLSGNKEILAWARLPWGRSIPEK